MSVKALPRLAVWNKTKHDLFRVTKQDLVLPLAASNMAEQVGSAGLMQPT